MADHQLVAEVEPGVLTGASLHPFFYLDPEVAYLNHGSFGATPRPVMERYQELQILFETNPMKYYQREAGEMLLGARKALGEFVNADASDVVFVTNATVAVNIVARSLRLGPGDAVLTTDHEYGACDKMWEYLRRRRKFSIDRVSLPGPATTQEEIVERMTAAITPNTRLLFISHITAPTALTFPVAEICRIARERGVLTLVDGAHAIGQIPIDMAAIDADFYTSNLHKWLCAPKGSAFLYARKEAQPLLDPLVVSWGWEPDVRTETTFVDHHEYRGTADMAAAVATERVLRFREEHRWDEVQRYCRDLLREARRTLATRFELEPLAPESSRWFSQMSAFFLPESVDGAALQRHLSREHNVEIPVFPWNDRQTLRISIQGYNTPSDIDRLCEGIADYLRVV